MIKIALVDPDPLFSSEISNALEEREDMVVMATAQDLNQALIALERLAPDVMIFGPGVGSDVSLPFIRRLTSRQPLGCILVALRPTKKLKAAAAEANAAEVLAVPVDPDALASSIEKAMKSAEMAADVRKGDTNGKCAVITVFSTKGGVGKTVLAINIAASMARKSGGRVVLADFDLQFGDVAAAMGLVPDRTLSELVGKETEDKSSMDDFLVPHESGVKVLLAPKEPESADLIGAEIAARILGELKERADFLIIDTPPAFNDVVLAALDATDEICVVLSMDVLSVKNARLCLRTLSELRYPPEKIKIAINKVEKEVGLRTADVEKALGMAALARIPLDKAVSRSVNKGVPVVLDAPDLPVSRELERLALYYARKYSAD